MLSWKTQKAENYGAQVALRMEWQDRLLAYDPDKCDCSEKLYSTESFKDFINAVKGRWPEFTVYNQQNNRWTQNKVVTVYPDGRVDFTKRIEAASANLLLFIAWNFAIGGDLPHLNYLTFMDALILSGFIISVTMVLYNVILRRMEIRGHREKADHIDRVMIYAYPLSFLVAISILYFVFLNQTS